MLLTEFGKIEQENVIVNKVCILITTCQSIADSAGAGCMEVVVSPPHKKKKNLDPPLLVMKVVI